MATTTVATHLVQHNAPLDEQRPAARLEEEVRPLAASRHGRQLEEVATEHHLENGA